MSVGSPLKRCRFSCLLPPAKQWIAVTTLNRRYIGGASEVGRRHSRGNLCLTLFLKRRVGAGQVQGRCRVLFLGRVLKISTTGRKKF